MQYKPGGFEAEYLKRLRDNKSNTLGISPGKTNQHIAAIPWDVDQEMIKKYGPTWYKNDKIFITFLKENPVYCVAARTPKQFEKLTRHITKRGVT